MVLIVFENDLVFFFPVAQLHSLVIRFFTFVFKFSAIGTNLYPKRLTFTTELYFEQLRVLGVAQGPNCGDLVTLGLELVVFLSLARTITLSNHCITDENIKSKNINVRLI